MNDPTHQPLTEDEAEFIVIYRKLTKREKKIFFELLLNIIFK